MAFLRQFIKESRSCLILHRKTCYPQPNTLILLTCDTGLSARIARLPHMWLPNALARKFPNAGKQFRWRYVFSSGNLSREARTQQIGRHHIDRKGIQQAVSQAAQKAGIDKHVTCHTLRHYSAYRIMPNDVYRPGGALA
jgi:integrase